MRARLALAFTALVFLVGFWKGLRGPGNDFQVFYHAARVALEGRAEVLYLESPDRYLYAPGFAYLMVPLGLLPNGVAHVLWLVFVSMGFFLAMRLLAKKISKDGVFVVSIAVLFLMRTIWIDLRYGQVNPLILAASVWALVCAVSAESSRREKFLSWFLFSLAAFAKLYVLPLFLIPLLLLGKKPWKKNFAPVFLGSVSGFLLLILLPFLFSGLSTSALYGNWYQALLSRGFPLDTHNQSVLAFLHRVFSGEVIRSFQTGGEPMQFWGRILSDQSIEILFSAVTFGILFLFVRNARRAVRETSLVAISLCIALCFLPGHLIWNSYFMMGIPLAAVVLANLLQERNPERKKIGLAIYGILFFFTHLSIGDVIGSHGAAWVEAFTPFLLTHFALIAFGLMI